MLLFWGCDFYQQQTLLKGTRSNWSSDEIYKVVTLRRISYEAFGFVTDVLKYPYHLPPPSSEFTMKRCLWQFSVSPQRFYFRVNILKTRANLFASSDRDFIAYKLKLPLNTLTQRWIHSNGYGNGSYSWTHWIPSEFVAWNFHCPFVVYLFEITVNDEYIVENCDKRSIYKINSNTKW